MACTGIMPVSHVQTGSGEESRGLSANLAWAGTCSMPSPSLPSAGTLTVTRAYYYGTIRLGLDFSCRQTNAAGLHATFYSTYYVKTRRERLKAAEGSLRHKLAYEYVVLRRLAGTNRL